MKEMDLFQDLPDELIILQALELDLPSITRLCQASSRFNQIICDNELFWRYKFIKDYQFNPIYYTGSWKLLYREYGSVWAFGMNDFGRLGPGDRQNRYIPTRIPNLKAKFVSAGGFHTILIDLNNDVWAFGMNDFGRLGLGDEQNRNIPTQIPNLKAKFASAGAYHSILIDLDDDAWAFGNNYSCQLGLGDEQDRYIPTRIPNLKAKSVSAGAYHSILIDQNDDVWVFGSNDFGQLGLGDQQVRNI